MCGNSDGTCTTTSISLPLSTLSRARSFALLRVSSPVSYPSDRSNSFRIQRRRNVPTIHGAWTRELIRRSRVPERLATRIASRSSRQKILQSRTIADRQLYDPGKVFASLRGPESNDFVTHSNLIGKIISCHASRIARFVGGKKNKNIPSPAARIARFVGGEKKKNIPSPATRIAEEMKKKKYEPTRTLRTHAYDNTLIIRTSRVERARHGARGTTRRSPVGHRGLV